MTRPSHTLVALLAILSLALGAWMLAPGDTAGFAAGPAYAAMRYVGPEELWGALFALAGLAGALSLRSRRTHWRALGALAMLPLWAFVAISFGMYSLTTMIPIYAVLALACAYASIQIGRGR
jgi:hypothetical protein